jgi:hypothetical protein
MGTFISVFFMFSVTLVFVGVDFIFDLAHFKEIEDFERALG